MLLWLCPSQITLEIRLQSSQILLYSLLTFYKIRRMMGRYQLFLNAGQSSRGKVMKASSFCFRKSLMEESLKVASILPEQKHQESKVCCLLDFSLWISLLLLCSWKYSIWAETFSRPLTSNEIETGIPPLTQKI